MSNPRANNPTGRPSEEDPDGVVLFDPTAYTPSDAQTPGPKGRRGLWALLIGLSLLAAGAYWAYETGTLWAPVEETVAPPPADSTEGLPRAPMLEALSRTDITGPSGSEVILAVRALGPGGPVADSSVLFEVTEGDGTLLSERSLTDVRGTARAELSLPALVGTVTVTARLAGTELSTEFTIGVLPGPVARIVTIHGDRQVAEVDSLVVDRVGVTVVDAVGNPVPGVEVRFSYPPGDIVAPERALSNSEGKATAMWRLRMEPGTHRLTAEIVGLDTTVTFSATATAREVVVQGRPIPLEAGPVTVIGRDFVIGVSHVCALAGGAASCRGATVRGLSAARSSGLIALATGSSHVCGLSRVGEAVCWGANEGGQLGDGTRTDRGSPVPVRTELLFSTLTAGATHTCGLAGGGVPICWGQNLNGQIGDGSRVDQLAPRAVGGGLVFTSLVAGWNHTCGLTDNRNAWCWGLNSEGQLGDGSRLDQLTPALVRAAVESIAAGSAHTCGIGGGEAMCWGENRFGQLGNGSTDGRAQPGPVQGLPSPPTQIVAGAVHSCALVADGSAHCWGQNLHGQLGNGSTQNSTGAVAVAGGIRFRSIHAGGALTCGFSDDGSQYCWGLNQNGQLGDGTRDSRSTPTLVQ
jgi:alpha-tubulin suppressor-like RCC1 family protein